MKTIHKHKLRVKKDDTVLVIAGNFKGKRGKVVTVIPEKNKAIVEGINIITKHVKPSAQNTEGGRVEQEAPIHISNLKLIDPATSEAVKVGRKVDGNGKLQRYSKKTGDII